MTLSYVLVSCEVNSVHFSLLLFTGEIGNFSHYPAEILCPEVSKVGLFKPNRRGSRMSKPDISIDRITCS
jgi:hypothetical protein